MGFIQNVCTISVYFVEKARKSSEHKKINILLKMFEKFAFELKHMEVPKNKLF